MEESEPTNPPRSTSATGTVRIARYAHEEAAELAGNALEQAGIVVQMLGAEAVALGLPGTFASIDLHVRAEDAKQATAILSQHVDEFLEPADDTPAEQTTTEPAPVLVAVGAYAYLREMRDVEAILASAGIETIPPRLMNRGDRPSGVGKRFVLRVAEADLPRVQAILDEEHTEDIDQPRCPKCASWNVTPVTHFWKDLAAGIGLAAGEPQQLECLTCHYQAAAEEFTAGT